MQNKKHPFFRKGEAYLIYVIVSLTPTILIVKALYIVFAVLWGEFHLAE